MKIIHYITSIDRSSGGVGSYMQLLASELGKLVELHIVTHQSSNELEIDSSHIHYVDRWRHPLKIKKQWLGLLYEIKPDIVHVNCCWQPESSIVQRLSDNRGFKTVYTPHGMLEPWIMQRHYWTRKVPALLLYQKSAITHSNVLHATADSECENLLNLGYNRNIAVIPNGIDVKNIQMKSNWQKTKTILFLSRIHVKKGVEFLIEAISKLRKEFVGYRVLIAGEGENNYIEQLNSLIKKQGLENIVSLIGGVYGEHKWKLFQQADVFVLPTHSENFGIVVAEALASGTPVITTTGTPWHELQTSNCGWWTKIGTEPLTEALSDFLNCSPAKLEEMGRNGRRLVEERYSVEAIAQQMKALYEWILRQGDKPNFVCV